MDVLSTSGNFLLILFGFGFLIFVHELGHFLAARWAGIRVDCFAIGMGPTIVSWRRGLGFRAGSTDRDLFERHGRVGAQMSDAELAGHGLGETEYTLRLLPIGGYVRMLGQEDANPSAVSDAPRSYQSCPIGKRMVVVSAGVIMNLITAVILFWIAFAVGVRFPAPVVGGAIPGTPAALAVASNASAAGLAADAPAGLMPGDRVLSIDGARVDTFADVVLAGAMSRPAPGDRTRGQPMELLVERSGATEPLRFTLQPELDEGDGLLKIGVGGGPALSPTITDVDESRATVTKLLANAGFDALVPGATLASVNGAAVRTLDEVEWGIARGDGSPLATVWSLPVGEGGADDATRTVALTLTPQASLQTMLVPVGEDRMAVNGLFGLSPLLRVEEPVRDGVNADVFRPGDILLRAGTVDAPNFADLRAVANAAIDQGTLAVTLLRDGTEMTLEARVNARGRLDVHVSAATNLPRIARPVTSVLVPEASDANDGAAPSTAAQRAAAPALRDQPTPAAALDLVAGSTITDIAGTPVSDWNGIRAAFRTATASALATGERATVEIGLVLPLLDRSRSTQSITLGAEDIRALHGLGWRSPLPPTIFDPSFVTLKATGPLHAVSMGLHETKKLVLQVYLTLDRLVRGTIGVDKLNGPVGIFHIGVKVADQGFMFLLFFIALLSVNLAVMNFLPLPIVDGGLFLFLIYEKIVGRPPSIGFQNAATAVGLLLIGSIFLITFYNDVARLIG